MKIINVAIDGPAGAGKSTISKAVARDLKYAYIDTGAMYRAVALKMIENNVDVKNDIENVKKIMENTKIDIEYSNDGQLIFLDGRDVTNLIRTPEISVGASDVSKIVEVRLKLVDIQRELAKKRNCVMDGRDIGTYVLPKADVKIFLTADVLDRAKRRYDEFVEKGENVLFEEVLKDMKYRDKNDSSREFAPLKPASDSIIIDTTGNTLEKSIDVVKNTIIHKIGEVLNDI